MVMVAVRGGCVCVGGWVVGGLELILFVLDGVLSKFLLNSRLCDCYEFLRKTAVSEQIAFLVSCYYGKVLGTKSEAGCLNSGG